MPGPIEAAGAAKEPTEYATLSMDTQFTGIWTQRNPLRDADVPYLYRKFYGASRFDSILDGINREITAKLTDQRRAGNSVYNSNSFPAINSFFTYKWVQNGVEQLHVLADGSDGIIYDATAGQKSTVFNKTAGAGKARFLGVNTELFITDGIDLAKWLQSSLAWAALTQFSQGNFIIDGSGNVQQASVATSDAIADVKVVQAPDFPPNSSTAYIMIVTFDDAVIVPPVGTGVAFAGLTSFTWANDKTLNVVSWPNLDDNQVAFDATAYGTTYGEAADTGNATLDTPSLTQGTGTTGATMPSFSPTPGDYVLDGTILWTCFGSNMQAWMPAAPGAPTLTAENGCRYWQPSANLGLWYAAFDTNENIQVINAQPGAAQTGVNQPNWNTTQGGLTNDGGFQWLNCGPQGAWTPLATMLYAQCVLDSNGNLQIATVPGEVGSTQPSWATGLGDTTTDSGVTWTCAGPGIPWASGTVQYAASFHCVDGSVTTASPVAYIPNGVLGGGQGYAIQVEVETPSDVQVDQVWLWRTAQGQAILVFDQAALNPTPGTPTTVTILDTIPDTSVTGGIALNPELIAPIASSGNPPPAGLIAPAYHMGRMWGIVANTVYYSAGPDTAFNGNTAWPPLNTAAFPAAIRRLLPVTVSNGGLLCWTSSGVQIILGTGTASNPFYATVYEASVNLAGYDSLDVLGSTVYFMEANSKVSSFDPQNGYTEVGFPIGDQFKAVTTGGGQALGVARVRATPSSGISQGAGQPWVNPQDATAADVGATVYNITAYSSSESAGTATFYGDFEGLVAGTVLQIAGLTGSPFNNFAGAVLSAGLSSSQFSIALSAYDISQTTASGTATSLGAYAQVGYLAPPVDVPDGQCVAWTFATEGAPVSPYTSFALGGCLGIGSNPYAGTAEASGGSGYLQLSGSGSTCLNRVQTQWGGFALPALPADAVIQNVYPVIVSSAGAIGGELAQGGYGGYPGIGSDVSFDLPSSWPGQSSGDSLGALTSSEIEDAYVGGMISQTEGTYGQPDYQAISGVALAVYYTTAASCPAPGEPTSPVSIGQLVLADLGLALPEASNVIGVGLAFQHGLAAGTTETLEAQLTIAGSPVGEIKGITQADWPGPATLGGQSDAWGATLGASQVNGSNGLGVIINGTISKDATVNLNDLEFTVYYSIPMNYSPGSTLLSWNIQSSGETAMYVANGNAGWFRLVPIAPPESGLLWCPVGIVQGGTSAVQSIETDVGVFNLLIGPPFEGPILMRDTTGTVWEDNGVAYPSWDSKGVIRLCESGQIAEVAHIGVKSTAQGARPTISILMDELAPTEEAPWDELAITSTDPPDLEPSVTMYSDRYQALQNGVTPKGDCVLVKFDYGTQAYGDELLLFSIYGRKQEERVQQ